MLPRAQAFESNWMENARAGLSSFIREAERSQSLRLLLIGELTLNSWAAATEQSFAGGGDDVAKVTQVFISLAAVFTPSEA